MNVFETASRKKFRYASPVGDLTTEQLWDLPLLANERKPNLDTIARSIFGELRSLSEESFVKTKPDPRVDDLTAKLEVLKHIIAVKQAEIEKAKEAAIRAEKRRKIADALAAKDDADLTSASREDLLKQLAELDG
jgi:hypothetical protein